MGKTSLLLIILCVCSTSGFLFKRAKLPLAIDGGWSAWGSWSSCHINSVNTTDYFSRFRGFSVSSRPRPCESPRPLLGGKPCQGSPFRYKQCGCKNPLGMQSGRIKNSQVSSSPGIFQDFDATKGRIGHPFAWCSDERKSPFASVYYEIDFVNFTKITGLDTEGIMEGRVSHFKLMHSIDKKHWTLYSDKSRKRAEFIGNILSNTRKFNEIHDPFVARYIRIYPIRSYTRACLKVEVYGCVFTCGKQLSSSSGEIIGRSEELFDQSCLWKVDVKNTTVITLDFITFSVPCEFGFLEIRDGNKPFLKSEIIRRFCGQELSTDLYKAPAKNLWIYFHSNSSSDEVGFRARYISACKNNLQLKGTEMITVQTPNYPNEYFDNNHCTWDIATDSDKVYLLFKEFDVEAGSEKSVEKCKNDFLSIEASAGNSKIKLKYCNSNSPPLAPNPMLISSRHLKLEFKSDNAIVGRGFLIQITTYDPTKPKPTPKITSTLRLSGSSPKPKDVLSNVNQDKLNRKPVAVTPKILKSNAVFSKKDNGILHGKNVTKFPNRNDTGLGTHRSPKKKKKTDWTIFIVASFSILVFILIVFVSVISIRKWMTSGQNSKFLPAAVKNAKLEENRSQVKSSKRNQSEGSQVRSDEQFCQLKSPAGSIAHVQDESEPENAEQMPLTTAIVSHEVEVRIERPRSYIDMYTDGEEIDLDENSSCLTSTKSEDPKQILHGETVI